MEFVQISKVPPSLILRLKIEEDSKFVQAKPHFKKFPLKMQTDPTMKKPVKAVRFETTPKRMLNPVSEEVMVR